MLCSVIVFANISMRVAKEDGGPNPHFPSTNFLILAKLGRSRKILSPASARGNNEPRSDEFLVSGS